MVTVRPILDLSEIITMIEARDISGQVDLAVKAERARFDGVIVSEQVVVGKGADSCVDPALALGAIAPQIRFGARTFV